MNKKALITGITGQDSSYLARFLLKKAKPKLSVIYKKPRTELLPVNII